MGEQNSANPSVAGARTLKDNILWARQFGSIDPPRLAMVEFQRGYNRQCITERHDYRIPATVRQSFAACLDSTT